MDLVGIGAWRFVLYVRCHTTRASWFHARPPCSAPPSASSSSARSFVPRFLHAGLAIRRSAVRFAHCDQLTGGLHPKSTPMPGAHKKAGYCRLFRSVIAERPIIPRAAAPKVRLPEPPARWSPAFRARRESACRVSPRLRESWPSRRRCPPGSAGRQ